MFAFVLGRNMCWTVSCSSEKEGRWLNLPFSTRLNSMYNKTLSTDVTTSQSRVCVYGMWSGICRRNGHLAPNFQLDRSHNQDQNLSSSVHFTAAHRKNVSAFFFCWDWSFCCPYSFYFRQKGIRTWSEHQFGSQGGHTWCDIWALNTSSRLERAQRVQGSLVGAALVQAHKPVCVTEPLFFSDHGIMGLITWRGLSTDVLPQKKIRNAWSIAYWTCVCRICQSQIMPMLMVLVRQWFIL